VLFLFRCTGISTDLITFFKQHGQQKCLYLVVEIFSNGVPVRLIADVRPNRASLQICGPTKRI